MVRTPISRRTGATFFMALWCSGANMKPIPVASMQAATCSGVSWMLTPSASSTSALPDCLEVTAWTRQHDGSRDEMMGVRHRTLAVQGVQFHPESILTDHGHRLLRNFLDQR